MIKNKEENKKGNKITGKAIIFSLFLIAYGAFIASFYWNHNMNVKFSNMETCDEIFEGNFHIISNYDGEKIKVIVDEPGRNYEFNGLIRGVFVKLNSTDYDRQEDLYKILKGVFDNKTVCIRNIGG